MAPRKGLEPLFADSKSAVLAAGPTGNGQGGWTRTNNNRTPNAGLCLLSYALIYRAIGAVVGGSAGAWRLGVRGYGAKRHHG